VPHPSNTGEPFRIEMEQIARRSMLVALDHQRRFEPSTARQSRPPEDPRRRRGADRRGHENDRAFYCEAWNGTGAYTYDRIGRGTLHIRAACVSVLGGIQPGPLERYLRDVFGGRGDDGLIPTLSAGGVAGRRRAVAERGSLAGRGRPGAGD
jgi:hypothetical protein